MPDETATHLTRCNEELPLLGVTRGEAGRARNMTRRVGVMAMSPVLLIGLASGGDSADAAEGTDNTLRITASEYEFTVEGELDAGTVSIGVDNVGDEFHEVAVGIDDVVTFFESGDEGPRDFAGGPLDFLAFVFDAEPDRTITVDLTEGQWAIQTPDPEQPFAGPPTGDPHTILVTVS